MSEQIKDGGPVTDEMVKQVAAALAVHGWDIGGEREEFESDIRQALATVLPEDMVLVPREPTQEMLDAFQEELARWSALTRVNDSATEAMWNAMLLAREVKA